MQRPILVKRVCCICKKIMGVRIEEYRDGNDWQWETGGMHRSCAIDYYGEIPEIANMEETEEPVLKQLAEDLKKMGVKVVAPNAQGKRSFAKKTRNAHKVRKKQT